MPYELPTPDQISEEPLRPLLATVQAATHNLLCAIHAENPDYGPTVPPLDGVLLDPALWTALALVEAIEHLHELLDLHDRALVERHAIRWRSEYAS